MTGQGYKPHSLDTLSDDLRWDIDRYLLDDPSLDRETFEQTMLEDSRLAWAVAERVGELQEIAQACGAPHRHRGSGTAPVRRGWVALAAVLAASILLIFSLAQWAADHRETRLAEAAELSAIADHWLRFEPGSEEEAELPDASWELAEHQTADREMADDWMLKAAEGFFQDAES